MTKSVSKIIRGGVSAKRSAGFLAVKFAALAFAAFLFSLSSCDVGLGESVDTQAPTIEITYPPVSAVIRDSFILYGSWSDDKSVSKISVSVMNTETKEVVLSNVSAEIGSGSWQIELNNKDDSNKNYYNGWQFADGTYQISVVATDNAGHTSGTVSRTFDIDNTPPVFVISNPGVVKKAGVSASAYGSIFTIDGTIADDHTISSMDVTIYDASGNLVSKETYNGKEIEAFHEDDIATAGGTSVTIAQYGENPDERYEAIYGNDKSKGTEYYTCSIKLTDSAQVYQSPTDSSSRSAEQVEADSAGNSTYSLYLYDDVYTTLMSAKKGLGLSAADLKNILNKTVKNEKAETALETLENTVIDTEKKDNSSNLYFSLNPQANPTYQVNGFEYSFDENATLQQASSGNTVSVTVAAGLDGTNIDPDGNDSQNSTVKVWMKEYTASPESKEELVAELTETLAAKVKSLEDDEDEYSESTFTECSKATEELPATEIGGWKLIYDYGKNNSGGASVSTKTFSVTLPEGAIVLNKYYILAVTGRDIDGVEFSQGTIYGFEGNEAGVPPTIRIDSPSNSSLVASSEFSFAGTAAVKSSSLYVKKLTATLTVIDQNDNNKELATFSQTISSSADKVWSAESSSSLDVFSCDSSGNWTFTPSKLSGYSTIAAAENSGESYLYTLEIYGAASSGHDTTVSSNVQIDSVLPVVSISSITPTVDGSEYDSSSNTYVNGTVTVKGTVEETNLESVSMQIFVDGSAVSYWTDDSGNATDTLSLGKVYSFSETIDTANSKIPDGKSLDVRVTATDKVGNQTTYSSLSGADSSYSKLFVLQETDRPVITLNNASNSSETDSEKKTFDFVTDSTKINATNGNLFGTISNNKLTATVSDDDSIVAVEVTVYDKDGKALSDDKVSSIYGLNPYKFTVNKSTYNLSYYLPGDEGVYKICVDAYDYLESDTNAKATGKGTTGTFFIAVSAGAPTIALNSVATYQTATPTFSGTVSSTKSTVSAAFTGAIISQNELDSSGLETLSQKLEVEKADDSISWTASIKDGESLENGEYSITFTASNDYGEKNSVEADFIVDSESPTVKITEYNSIKSESSDGFTTGQIFYLNPENIKTIKGTCADSVSGIDSVYYYIGDNTGKESPSTENGWLLANLTKTDSETGWTVSLTDLGSLTDGEKYPVHIKATDKAGNISDDCTHITLYIDKTGPVLTASVSDSGLTYTKDEKTYRVYGSNSFNVSVTAEDVAGVASVSANSTSLKGTDGTYTGTVSATPDSDGFASISVVATDSVGNSSTKTIDDIMIDLTAPAVSISSYPEKAAKEEFTLSGTVSDNIGVKSVVITDSLDSSKSYKATVNGGTWSVTLKPTAQGEGENETKDGSHTYTAVATDKVGNTSNAACRVTTDTTAPYWYTGNKDLAEPYISTKSSSEKITVSDVEYSLYNSASVTVAAKAKDATTSVSNLLYNLNDEKDDSSALVWKSADNGNFSVENLSEGVNTLKIKAVDEAGNENTAVALSFFVDSAAPAEPELKSVDSDSDESSMTDFAAQNKQKLVNGKEDVTFTVAVEDDISSGEKAYSGIASVELTKIGNKTLSASVSGTFVSEKNGKSVYSITIPHENLASGSATVTVKDKAGNATTLGMFNFLLDSKAPTVLLSSPAGDVNKTISLSGSATDNQEIDEETLRLEYSTDNSSWESLSSENAGSKYKAVISDSAITVTEFDTTKFDDNSTVYVRAAISDKAKNEGVSDSVALKINQDSDRPSVKISNLTKLSGGFILKYGTKAQLTGTVSDDDSTSSAVVKQLVISESPYAGSGDITNLASFDKATGDFTFTPSDTEDGAKTLYFYIKDNGGSEFYTTASASLENPKLYLKTEKLEDSVSAAAFTYNSDSASPQVENVEGKISASSSAEKTAYSGISVSFVAGGDDRYLNLRVKASDANGIDGILLDVADSSGNTLFKRATASEIAENTVDSSTNESDGNFTLSGSAITSAEKYYVNSSDSKTSDGTSYIWELASALDLGSVPSGSLTITVKPYDNSGLFGNGSYTFMVDNSGPSVKMTSPSSSTIVSGSSINVSGTATEIGSSSVDSIQWLIPTSEQQGWNDSALNALEWKGELSKVSTASAWTFVFNGTDNALLSDFTKDTTYASPDSDGVYTLPIYFKATDALGNYTICKDYSIRYNPDADRPVTQITYPDSSILTKDSDGNALDYAVLGGKIRVTGTVEIPSGDSTAYQVYLQVSDDNGNFDDSDKATANDTYGFAVLGADELESAWKTAQGSTSSLNFSNESSANTEKRNAWWGIPATLYSSKTSWYIVINDNEQMNASSDTNNVKIRVCGVGENGKVGLWSDSYSIHIDSQVPRYSESPLLYQYLSELSTGDAFYSASPSSSQAYSSGIYLKGQWYLCTSVTDETKVKVNSVSLGSTALSYGTDYFVWPESANNSSGNAAGSEQKDSSGRNISYVYIKIDTDKTSTQSYTITAEDSDANGSNTSTATFEVNADNVAPVFSLNSSGKPVITDGSDSEISMTKLKNSDHVVTFGSTATDSGSGFERIAFYFARIADGKTTVELPIPLNNGSAWENSSSAAYVGEITSSGDLQTDKDLTDSVDANYSENALYGVTLSGASTVDSSLSTTTFTADSDISDYKFIREGGIIKLSGIYYTISSVSGNAITIDGIISTSPTTAFVPAALIVDNTSAESIGSWSSGFVINGDAGDGIIESVKKSGSTWTWSASVYLDELEDGPVTLVAIAFDKAGNVRTLETSVMIANNTPRLAKVYLATDLNGDGKFTDNELGTSTMSDTNETQKFYSALTNGTSGRVQEILTIENASGSGVAGITMRNDLGLSFEFVSGSGSEGYGSGNGTLYYKLAVADSALTTATSGTDGTLETADSASYDKTAETTTAGIVETGLKGFKIPTNKFKYGSATSGFDYNEWASSNVLNEKDSNKINYIGVTLWDSTKGTEPGTGDTADSDGNITAFGSQWTVVNIPLYIDLVDDQFPVPLITDPAADSSSGHVDLSSTLPDTNFAGTSGEFDTDTKISGTVVFTGTVTDEKRVDSIYLTTSRSFSSTPVSSIKIASYDSASGSFALTQPATGLTFAITSNEFSTENGHTVGWSLTVDTSKVEGIAAADVTFTVAASDGTNTNSSGAATEPAEYQADIVPYITGIVRSSTSKSNTAMNRSTYGEYPVAVGDKLKVSGWNFGTSPTVKVGSESMTVSNANGTSFTIDAPANSGELTVTVNGIVSLNDKNNNAAESNLDSDGKFDNRYIRVWDVGHYFSNSDGGNEPTLAADNSGNLFSTWTLMGTGAVMMQRMLSSASYPIYAGYDQPDKETQLGIDKKSSNAGSVSVIFFPANVGSGGTPTSNGYADAQNIGGVWGLGMSNNPSTTALGSQITTTGGKESTSSTQEYKRFYGTAYDNNNKNAKTVKQIRITGNPYNKLDSSTWTAGWQLASGAMRREVSQFKQGRTVRYGDNMHYVYYDSVNKALRYTYQPISNGVETSGQDAYRNDISGWTLIDGKNDAQDRIHTTSKSYSGIVSAYSGTTVTLNESKTVSAGDTVAIAYLNTSGVYKIALRTVSKASNGTSVTVSGSVPSDVSSVTGGAIYCGDSNVVTNGVSKSSSAGSYLALDVTSGGRPVIVYYDAASEGLRIAYSTSATPSMTDVSTGRDTWTRQTISGVSSGTYVQAKIDGNNYLHIMYRDSDGKLCYLKSTNNPDGGSYTFGSPMTIDSSGTYGTLSVMNTDSGYVPCVSWLNSEGTANGVKYALLRNVDTSDGNTESLWDVQIVPAVVDKGNQNHYVSGGELVYVEGKSGFWNATEDGVSMGDCDSVVGFNTGRMDVVFLKSEK